MVGDDVFASPARRAPGQVCFSVAVGIEQLGDRRRLQLPEVGDAIGIGGFLVDQVTLQTPLRVDAFAVKLRFTTRLVEEIDVQGIPVICKKGRVAVADRDVSRRVLDLLDRLYVVTKSLQGLHDQQGLEGLLGNGTLQRLNDDALTGQVRRRELSDPEALSSALKARLADILRATIGTEISPALVLAVISVESGGRTDAVSGAGAQGLMQLIPATADRFGVNNALEAQQNIKGGVAYHGSLVFKVSGQDGKPIVLDGNTAGTFGEGRATLTGRSSAAIAAMRSSIFGRSSGVNWCSPAKS